MKLIKVNADQCNSQGITNHLQSPIRSDFFLNVDLIAGIKDNFVYLKNGRILSLGDNFFTNIKIDQSVDLTKL